MEKMKVDSGAEGTKYVQMDFPGNSKKEKSKEERKTQPKVTDGKVIRKKKSLGKRITETLTDDDTKSVSSYILYDVLIPAAKNTISDAVTGGIEMLLFGERRYNNVRREKGRSYVSYDGYYSKKDSRDSRSYSSGRRMEIDEIVLESRGEAEEVLSRLVDLIDEYGMASVAELYDLVGVTSNFTDNKWGWTNISSARVDRVREGYLLRLPRVKELD